MQIDEGKSERILEPPGPFASNARFLGALVAMNLKSALALRGAFWLQAGFMALNNFIFFSVWWIFFARFDEIGGWRLADMAALYGLVAMSFGATIVLAGGVRDLAEQIVEGELDAMLTQPKELLIQVAGARTYAAGWGDFASGLFLLVYSGVLGFDNLGWALVAASISICVFASTGVILGSLAFWLGRVNTLVRQLWEFQITFALYPDPLFGGAVRFLIYSVIPAGFIGHLPISLLRDFAWPSLGAAVLGALAYALLARAVFAAGVRGYESGNRMVSRH